MTAPAWTLGLMTGTALDGFVDAALIRTDGREIAELGPYRLHPYSADLRAELASAIEAARAWDFEGPEPAAVTAPERAYAEIHAEAVAALLAEANLKPQDVALLGFHGLTVLHRPAKRRTRQIGDGALLASLTGIDCAFDFRTADVEAGGQGAPLAPLYHAALMRYSKLAAPAAALNLGGVANLTWWAGGEEVAAFDTGPANGPVNEWVEAHGAGTYDKDGALAAAGLVHESLLLGWLDQPFFDAPYPKSLDRYDFPAELARGLTLEDGAATLTAFSAACVGLGLDLFPSETHTLIACGGGRKNPVLMSELAQRTGAEVLAAEAVGWRGDAIEAEAFAFLAMRVREGLPLGLPSTTGVAAPQTGGRIAPARSA
jgi:anhydro-N-acetylmuramic acid kinase